MPSTPTDPAAHARIRRALAILYTMPGIPFLYYGDELAIAGGNDPDNRRDMVFDGALSSLAMTPTVPNAQQLALRDFVRGLGRARASSSALRRGRRIPLVVQPDVYVVAWTGDRPGDVAILVANRGSVPLTSLAIDGLTAGQLEGITSFTAAAGPGTLTLAPGARLRATLPAGEASIFLGTGS